jgi:hypothetical protein
MKAFAVLMMGEYWLVFAENHSKAKGAVVTLAWSAEVRPLLFKSLRCRRWSEMDGAWFDGGRTVEYWGFPGTLDRETGIFTETPAPFLRRPEAINPSIVREHVL